MSLVEHYSRELAAWMIRRARAEHPGCSAWMACLLAARSPEQVGDADCLAAIRSVAVKFPIRFTLGTRA